MVLSYDSSSISDIDPKNELTPALHTKVVIDPSLDFENSTSAFNSSLLDALQA